MSDLFEHVYPTCTQSAAKTYPESPGWKGGDTSRQAAEEIQPQVSGLQRRVLTCLKATGGLNASECARFIREDEYNVRPRLSELMAKGLIRDSGKRRVNSRGKQAKVYEAL